MNFWDSPAPIQLYVEQQFSKPLQRFLIRQPSILVWWGTQTECVRAFCRLCREGAFGAEREAAEPTLNLLLGLLADDWKTWSEIEPTEIVRRHANEAARRHGLRTIDALQLGAALAAADGSPLEVNFVCCDSRLSAAASAEGFQVVDLKDTPQ